MDQGQALDMDLDQAQQYGLGSGPTILIKIKSYNID